MLQLRPHQQEVVDKLSEGFKNGHRCQILYAPTGFGKTEVAMAIMKSVADKFKKTAIVLDRVVLVEQTSLRLAKYDIPHGVMQSTHWRKRPHEPIQVCSAQTLEKRQIIPDMDLLIVDEAHVQRKGTTDLIKNNPHLKVIGLTATPFTNGLGSTYSHVVGASSTGELIDKGWLTPLKVFIAKEIDMTGIKKQMGEWAQGDVTNRGMQITGDIVAEWHKKTYEIYGKPMKTIVFCAGVKHGKDLEHKFKEAGYNFVSISYKEDDEFKRQTIEEFSKHDTKIHGLIATDILTRGFDVSDVCIGVSARPFSKSFSSHVQQLGRVMRPHEGKEFALWLDHSGNYLRFRKDWDDLYDFGVKELKEGKETTRAEPTEREKRDSKCPACGGLWTSSNNICDECGFEKINPKEVVTVAGELLELDAKNRANRIDNAKFYSEMLFYAREKGYKEGWAAYKYKERFEVFPPRAWSSSTGTPPSPETLNWIKSRAIRYNKGRAKWSS
jgi:superfamily II DNA or RNA helicase